MAKALKTKLDDDEKLLLGKMTSELMSDEESGEDGVLVKRHPISKVRIVGEFSLRRPAFIRTATC